MYSNSKVVYMSLRSRPVPLINQSYTSNVCCFAYNATWAAGPIALTYRELVPQRSRIHRHEGSCSILGSMDSIQSLRSLCTLDP